MKSSTFKIISTIILFISSHTLNYAQTSGIPYVNKQLRAWFVNLNLPPNPKWFLYDMAAHVTDSSLFTTNAKDTIETATFYQLYEEFYHMAYDTNLLIYPDTLYNNGHSFYADTIPMGIMNYAFYKLKPNALTSNTYFVFDTANNVLYDKTPRPGFPYLDSNIFAAAPLVKESYFSNPVFRIDPDFILKDPFNASKYTPQRTIEIDFGDGNGFVSFDPSKVTHYTANYSSVGYKFIRTVIKNASGNKIIHSSNSRVKILSAQQVVKPTSYITTPGLNVGVFGSCNSDALKTGKLVIYLSGFDILDFLPAYDRGVTRIYSEMISNNSISQLKNQGYSFVVVDYKNSRIDMRFNALYVLNLLEKLKCGLDMGQQFVIMGESMGGLIGRFVMTYMESPQYMKQNTSPFFVDAADPNNSTYLNENPNIFNLPEKWCLTDKKHNTRLLITLDTPHQGANIPLSIQHTYEKIMKILGNYMGADLRAYTRGFNFFIDGQAAQQMLIYHIDTKNGNNYYSHPDKTSFFTQLQQLGDYPKYAKTTAMSNGSLAGEPQTNYYNNQDRKAGDRLLDFEGDLYARILGVKFKIIDADFECLTNPNGYGKVFEALIKTYSIQLKLYWFGVKFQIGYIPIYNSKEYAITKSFCVNAGGYTGEPILTSTTPSYNGHHTSNKWILNIFEYNAKDNGNGCVIFDGHIGFNGIASVNLDFDYCTDGTHFTLVPVQSALDYGVLGVEPVDKDIENENINLKLNKVKPDVIIGYPGSGPYQNWNHLGSNKYPFRNVGIYNITQMPGPKKDYTYYSCVGVNDDVERGLVNLEIGDEELYLENAQLAWTSVYETEYDIHVNDRNPYYEYVSTPKSGLMIDGVYSKEDAFVIKPVGSAQFVVDKVNSPTRIGLQYSTPYTGTYKKINQSLSVCCIDFLGSRLAEEPKSSINIESNEFVTIFPNPNNGQVLMLKYKFKEKGNIRFELINNLGEVLIAKNLNDADPTLETTRLIPLRSNLSNGMYLVRLSNGSAVLNNRLIIVN